MKELTANRFLPPLFKTNAEVIERDAVGVKTFATGSKYGNLLRREVQHLTELHFLLADFFFCNFALFDFNTRAVPFNDVSEFVA
jgi:hypothetical protein